MAYTAIDDPSAYFQADTYTGGQTITFDGNSDLQPDWIWIKARTTAENWRAFDTSRGIGNGTNETKALVISGAAGSEESSNIVTSMNSDGVTLNTSDAFLNSSSHTYLLSAWKANGGSTSSNTSGSITSTVQANTTAGFSIVTYVGVGSATVSTIGHSLGAVPDMIIIKTRSDTESWNVYHQAIGNTKKLFLNTNGAEATTGNFDDTSPTSTLFTVTGDQINDSSDNVIAYCFKGIQGYSKFGSYEGNGIADGTFVYTGFKPAWLLLKQSNASGEHWRLLDSTRSTFNQVNKHLAPSIAGLESAETGCDFLSNGFKLRDGDTHQNGDGHDYVYAAFAEQPFVSSTGIPATAR